MALACPPFYSPSYLWEYFSHLLCPIGTDRPLNAGHVARREPISDSAHVGSPMNSPKPGPVVARGFRDYVGLRSTGGRSIAGANSGALPDWIDSTRRLPTGTQRH